MCAEPAAYRRSTFFVVSEESEVGEFVREGAQKGKGIAAADVSAEIEIEHYVKASVLYRSALDAEQVHAVYIEFGQQSVKTTLSVRYFEHY